MSHPPAPCHPDSACRSCGLYAPQPVNPNETCRYRQGGGERRVLFVFTTQVSRSRERRHSLQLTNVCSAIAEWRRLRKITWNFFHKQSPHKVRRKFMGIIGQRCVSCICTCVCHRMPFLTRHVWERDTQKRQCCITHTFHWENRHTCLGICGQRAL